jgi:CheY-like chemotaxis protein
LSVAGTRVFIVEDEALILFNLHDMLEELGCVVVASAARIHDALAKAGSQSFDAAILDVNVAGERIDPVADLLANRGIPFFFVTGYGRQSMPAAHRQRLAVSKPYQADDLRTALGAVLAE